MSIRAKNPIGIQQLEATMRQLIAKKTGRIVNGSRNKVLEGGLHVFSVKRAFFIEGVPKTINGIRIF